MEFDGSFGSAEMSPVKEADGQVDKGRIQADELILKPEYFLPDSLVLEALKEEEKEFLIELPGPVFVGVG
jgi:hypothetical protein